MKVLKKKSLAEKRASPPQTKSSTAPAPLQPNGSVPKLEPFQVDQPMPLTEAPAASPPADTNIETKVAQPGLVPMDSDSLHGEQDGGTVIKSTDMIKPEGINDGGLVDHLQPALDNLTEREHDEEKVGSHQAADIKVDAGVSEIQAGTEFDQKQVVSESDPKPEASEIKAEGEQIVDPQGEQAFRLCRLLNTSFLLAVP